MGIRRPASSLAALFGPPRFFVGMAVLVVESASAPVLASETEARAAIQRGSTWYDLHDRSHVFGGPMFDTLLQTSFLVSLATLVYALVLLGRERRRFFTGAVKRAITTSPPDPIDIEEVRRLYRLRRRAAMECARRALAEFAADLAERGFDPRAYRRLADAAEILGLAEPFADVLETARREAQAHGDEADATQSQVLDVLVARGLVSSRAAKSPRRARREPAIMHSGIPAADELIGRELGGCRLIEFIGQGGTGMVFRAWHTGLERQVAVKILRETFATSENHLERFRREARTASRLDDPRIVRILHVGRELGLHFITMEHVDGRNLEQVVREDGPLKAPEAMRLLREIALGLAAAHESGVVHRDVKPQNVLVTSGGAVSISDFGLARAHGDGATLTRTGQVLGTPAYMSPEQCRGDPTDQRADLYSLGATAYFMLTGRVPFTADSSMAVMFQHLHDEPREPSVHAGPLPTAVETLVLDLLKKDPADRSQSALDVAKRCDAFLEAQKATLQHSSPDAGTNAARVSTREQAPRE